MTRRITSAISCLAGVLLAVQPGAAQERGPAGTVTLARTEYDRLLDLASRRPRPPDGAPIPAALTRADIRVRVANGAARGTMTVDGEVFHTGIVKIPLISNATLLDARTADRPLPLIAEGHTHLAVVAGPAAFSATLEWGATVTTAPGRGSFVLPVPSAGSATATFDVPGEGSDLRIAPGLVMRRTSAGGRTVIEATLDPGSATQVWWSARDSSPATPPRDVRLLSETKNLITIGDADLRLVSLVDVNVVQGEPASIEVQIPHGYELAGVTGAALDRTEQQGDRVQLFVSSPARRYQFLLNLERASAGGSTKVETTFPSVPAAQRETGEVAVEGIGTLELTIPELNGLKRMDVREVDPALAAAARQSLLAAFRYQRGSTGTPALALNVTRFPDAAVLAAIAERAVATTLVTSEGRALTEVSMRVRNRAQPFMKVALPPGATMLSVDVAGSPAKPVEGADGMRVPLLRPGFRPDGPYTVAFVYLHAGTPFARKGEMQMALPKMDVPVSVVEWELFVPDRYKVDRFEGTAIAADLLGVPYDTANEQIGLAGGRVPAGLVSGDGVAFNQIVGRVVDSLGAALPGTTVIVKSGGQERTVVTDANGWYTISNVLPGAMVVTGQMTGFRNTQRSLAFDGRPRQVDLQMQVGEVSETVSVTADAPVLDMKSSEVQTTLNTMSGRNAQNYDARADKPRAQQEAAAAPSANVQSLQRRAAGVLPVRIDVPRAGSSHRFVKPLVVDEETVVSFRYKRR
jgi:hypothetical protein